jgi:hypothetical protein
VLRIQGRDAEELTETSLSEEDHQEDDLREWIIGRSAEVLGEDLLVIGRETAVADLGDGIDILALDRSGSLVVVELKRGALRKSVDFQSLKYVSYVSRWTYEDIEQQFNQFLQSEWGTEIHGEDASFADRIEEFCDDDYELNARQRIFLVGNTVRERIGSVVLWLREQGIDVSIVQFSLLKDPNDELYLDSKTLVPTSDLEKFEKGASPPDKPWKRNPERWHLEDRSNDDTAVLVRNLVERLEEIEGLDGPNWSQKVYIAFRTDGTNRVLLRTRANSVILDVRDFDVAADTDIEETASEFLEDSSWAELDTEYQGSRTRLTMKCRPEDNIDTKELTDFVGSILEARVPSKE